MKKARKNGRKSQKIFTKIFNYGTETLNSELAEKARIPTAEALSYARENSARMITQINKTTRQEIKALFVKNFEANSSIQEIARQIREKFSSFSSYRASLIATQETAMAYEGGKKRQFEFLKEKYKKNGWKKAITQTDYSVRETHRQNALDGWIEYDKIFSGTENLAPPFGFLCRCSVAYKLDEPNIYEKLRVYYKNIELPNIGDAQAGNIEKISKNLQKQLPWLPAPEKIAWFEHVDENIMGGFEPTKNAIFLNKKSLFIYGYQEMKETLEHEYGHSIIHFLRQNPEELIYNIKSKELYEEIFSRSSELLNEENEIVQNAFDYPFSIIKTKKYGGKILEEKKLLEIAKEEVFAEAMRYYQNGTTDFFPEYYKILMDFIFQNQEEIAKKKSKWAKSKIKFYEPTGEELEAKLKAIDNMNKILGE